MSTNLIDIENEPGMLQAGELGLHQPALAEDDAGGDVALDPVIDALPGSSSAAC